MKGPRYPPLRAVMFDLDGTLVDSAPDLAFAANRMLAALDSDAIVPTLVEAARIGIASRASLSADLRA